MPWRDLHARFGNWKSVCTRWSRWNQSGLWNRLLQSWISSRCVHKLNRETSQNKIVMSPTA
ncbi:MAG: hypothetical protein CMO80_09785 [Verrucomicrobiales bacterium]|nr:hypothetical protein [Verrucomicrobiales bacterium]